MDWTRFDVRWMLSLFGTAVGAGILFLPIRAGVGGFWPVVAMVVLIFPMVWLSHRALSRFVAMAADNDDITEAAEQFWGRKISFIITILYFFAIYPICLAYGVGITNTFGNFFIHQIGWEAIFDPATMTLYPLARAALSIFLVSSMMAVMVLAEETITKICNALVYPLCAVLLGFSIYLIPHWKLDMIAADIDWSGFFISIWLTLPVLVFAFNHSPAISTFTMSVKRQYPQNHIANSNQILFGTAGILLFFVMFFVFSCILCLNEADFAAARAANIPILSYFANELNNPLISYGAPVVAFLAIVSSFFGHYFGAYEGLNGIVRKGVKMCGVESPNEIKIRTFSTLFMLITIIWVSYINPSILDFIENLGGPIIATILFIMPIIGIYTVPSLKKFRSAWLDIFVLATGLITISSVIYKLF